MAGRFFNRRNTIIPIEAAGIWIECCYRGCKKWRYCPDYEDPLDVPEKWYCHMNSDEATNKCSVPESTEISEHEVFVSSLYKAGSIVWAKVVGHPWSPAMVDFCPEYECYYWFDGDATEPTQYHVTFLSKDKVTRAWVKCGMIKPFVKNQDPTFALNARVRGKVLSAKKKAAILEGCDIAREAFRLSLVERLKKYDSEAWKIAKQTHDLLKTTSGIVTKPAPLVEQSKKQRKQAKSRKVTDPSNISLRNRKVSPELDAPPPKDQSKKSKAQPQEKVAPKAIGVKEFSTKEKPAVVIAPVESSVRNSDSSRTDTPGLGKESPDLDDTRSIDSVFPDAAVIHQKKQTSERNVENRSLAVVSNSENISSSQNSLRLRVSEADDEREENTEENKLSQPESEFEAVLNSPEESKPSNLSLKLKSIRESKLTNCKVTKPKANSEDLETGKDRRRENKPEESRYLRALSEFNINDNKKRDYKLLDNRPLRYQKELPEWFTNREKRNEVLDQRADKIMSEISSEEDSNMFKENRENFIAQLQQPRPGPSNSRDPRLLNNYDFLPVRTSFTGPQFTSDEDDSS